MAPPRTDPPAAEALGERELAELQSLLDALPAPLEPLDASAIDGYLVGVLLQPRPLAPSRWLPYVADVDGRTPPRGTDLTRLHALVQARHAELARAIQARRWFDPWVFEPEEPDATPTESMLPWVAGFATAMALFPALSELPETPELLEPLALLYAALDPDDLEDADALLAEIDTLEPPATLAEAVEDIVRASLLLADVVQPRPGAGGRPARG